MGINFGGKTKVKRAQALDIIIIAAINITAAHNAFHLRRFKRTNHKRMHICLLLGRVQAYGGR